MIRSMTGFGRCEASDDARKAEVEIRSVNHRYLDLSLKLPKRFSGMENDIRSRIRQDVYRGKVEVSIVVEDFSEGQAVLHYNRSLAGRYMEVARQMEEEFSIPNGMTAEQLSRMPEVITMENVQTDDDKMQALVLQALDGALSAFTLSREKEGAALQKDLLGKLDHMDAWVVRIETRYPQVVSEYRQRLTDKVKELVGDANVEEGRLAEEVVIYADKICVDEETVRLKTHIRNMRDVLLADGQVGRKLDFLAQEMNRESNTILSKSSDADIADTAIDLKTEVEKVREQIQNIE